MVDVIPSVGTYLTSEEKCFASLLESRLESDYLCWYKTVVGQSARVTDFVVLHPHGGMILLDVKDWILSQIMGFSPEGVIYLDDGKRSVLPNPLAPLKETSKQFVSALQSDPSLIVHDGPHKGSVACPCGIGIVLPNITRPQFEKSGMDTILPAHLCIFQDEIVSGINPQTLQRKLKNMLPGCSNPVLSSTQLSRVQMHMLGTTASYSGN